MKCITKHAASDLLTAELEGEELLPCPFCGSEAELAHTWTAAYWVECLECEAQRSGEYGGDLSDVGDPDHDRASHIASAKSAVEAWNTRA